MASNGATRSIGPGWLPALAVFALGLAYIERPLLTEGLISGRITDTYIQIAILQNWSNCLSGAGTCLAPNYFFPHPSTLGYNDGYLISGLLFHALRLLGFDPLIAYELVYATVRLIGFAATIVLGVRVLALPLWAAVLAAWLALVSINLLNQIEHSQMIYAAFLPLGILLLVRLLDSLHRLTEAPGARREAWVNIAAIGVLSAAWAVTAFYSFFCFFLVSLLFMAAYSALRPQLMGAAIRGLIRHPSVLAALVIGAAMTPVAVWTVYGATLMKSGAHPWSTGFNPRLFDLFNVGPDNLVWSRLLAPLYQALAGTPMVHSELAVGVPPIVLIGSLAALALLLGWLARRLPGTASLRGDHAGLVVALAIAAVLTVAFVLVFGRGTTAWRLLWTVLPGAKAIRVPARFLVFVTPLTALCLAYVLTRALERISPQARIAAIAATFLVLSVEQYHANPTFTLPRTSERAFYDSVPPPPAQCRSFYVSLPRYAQGGSAEMNAYYLHAVDAMMIAALYRIPTVNGMASFLPSGWNLTGPFEPDYETRVAAYAQKHGIAGGLCALQLKPPRWIVR